MVGAESPCGLSGVWQGTKPGPSRPMMARDGVTFRNSHSVYPTLTMPNAAALATGHYPGDTGVFGNAFLLKRKVLI